MKNNDLKVLIIGYGSIGRRHDEVLSSFNNVCRVDLVTKQDILNKCCYLSLQSVPDLSIYDYFLVTSETSKHFEQLQYLEKNVENKTIFCEKPLFDSKLEFPVLRNQVYVGYVLRFHPLLQNLKARLYDQRIIYVNIRCGQYLPTWRPNVDYRQSYSAKKSKGGGVLLDLSHEIDYAIWLLGGLELLSSIQEKVTNLEIDSDDLTMIFAKCSPNTMVNITLDYISKLPYREIVLHTNEYTYYLDLITNEMKLKKQSGPEEIITFPTLERNSLFKKMHCSILAKQTQACSYDEAQRVMAFIEKIRSANE